MTPQTDVYRLRQTTSGSRHRRGARLRAFRWTFVATAGALLLIADQCAAEFIVSGTAQVDWIEVVNGITENKQAWKNGSGVGSFSRVASGAGGSASFAGGGSGGPQGGGSMYAQSQTAPQGPKIVGSSAFGDVRVDVTVPVPVNVVYGTHDASQYTIYKDGGIYTTSSGSSSGSFVADYSFLININAVSYSSLPGQESASAFASMTWAPVGQVLPGKSPLNGLKPDPPWDPSPDDGPEGIPPTEVLGAFSVGEVGIQASPAPHVHARFNTPVFDDYGRDSPLFFDPTYYGSQLYTVVDNLITSLLIPEALPGGDSEFSVRFGDEGQFNLAVHAGEIFDFRNYVAGGIPWFVLAGLDLPNGPSAASVPPFVTGLTFAENGVQRLRIWTTDDPTASPVPEPATLTMLCTAALAVLGQAAVRRRRRTATPNRV